jgi:hypothetical protein
LATGSAKEFLAQECANLQAVLEETLRFKYGLEGSREFFEECQSRLRFIANEIDSATEADVDVLRGACALLAELSDLISRIERSSIGEYSWPFVEELKKIAIAMCTEATAANPNTPPQVHVLSAGGLDAYAIQPELRRPSGSAKRIHTIVLPKTLKHSVLLHSILGHEVGHAMLRCSKYQQALIDIFQRELFANTVFANPLATANWVYSPAAPQRVKDSLAAPQLVTRNINQTNFFSTIASWPAWMEEVMCDFIGLLTFGPSFVAAECNLLYATDPSASGLGPRHPPVGCRANYLLSAAKLAGDTFTAFKSDALKRSAETFWTNLGTRKQSDAWFNVFPEGQIKQTVEALTALLTPLAPALYPKPTEEDLDLLMNQVTMLIPPVGFQVGQQHTMCWQKIDFRHVLYAGWIASAIRPDIPFAVLNRLCEHGIMQQRAINMELGIAEC